MSMFSLRGTPNQKQLVRNALDRCDFPFERLAAQLTQQWGKTQILVEWADLSVAASVIYREYADEGGWHAAHKLPPDVTSRERTLGTAWTDGRIYIDYSCESDPELAAEVFLSEAAHQVDFFYLTDEDREAIWDVYHDIASDIGDHGHGWFDQGAYETWVGESLMGGFTHAYSDVAITLDQFVHTTTDAVARQIREIITPELGPPPWDPDHDPTPPPEPEPTPLPWWRRFLNWLLRLLS